MKMGCEEFLNQLNARADGELPAEHLAELDAHLAACPECKAAAEGLQTIDADLRRAFNSRRDAAVRLAESTVAKMRAGAVASGPMAPTPAPTPMSSRTP